MATKTANNVGSIVQVIGPVVDVEFSGDASMPALLSALEVEYEVGGQKTSVVLEVQQHLGDDWARAVAMSVPGARPRPRSIRPGNSVASVPNCSAMTSGAWLDSMMPPAPTLMVWVPAATCPITTDVAALAMPGMLWCSASQYR